MAARTKSRDSLNVRKAQAYTGAITQSQLRATQPTLRRVLASGAGTNTEAQEDSSIGLSAESGTNSGGQLDNVAHCALQIPLAQQHTPTTND